MMWWMSLGIVVSEVRRTRSPKNDIVNMNNTVTYPIVAHVNSLGVLEADSPMSNTVSRSVISDDRGGSILRVAQILQNLSGRGKRHPYSASEEAETTLGMMVLMESMAR